MKNKTFRLAIFPIIALTLCNCTNFRSTTSKTVNVYDLDKMGDSVSSGKTGEVKARFNKNEEYVPYLSLKQYASLYNPHLLESATSNISKKGDLVTWTVIEGNTLYYLVQIDYYHKEVITAGNLDPLYKPSDDVRDTTSLYYGNETTYESKLLGPSYYSHYSFADEEIDYYSYFGEYYMPLSFYDITCSFDTSIYFYYNYQAIYSTRDIENFYNKQYQRGSRTYCVVSEMMDLATGTNAPSYVVNLNSNLFLYLLDNFYGLKEYKGINSAVSYCQAIGTYSAMFNTDGAIRSQAYAETLDRLDDNHTALVAGSYAWGGQSYIARQYGTGCLERSALRGKLNRIRRDNTSDSYRDTTAPILSSDGKTAMFFFDEFVYGSTDQVFDKNGRVKETAKNYDTFYKLLDFFKQMQNTSTVENIIFDMSTNGGGVLGVLMKLLALISTQNSSNLYYYEAASQQVGIATTRVDSDSNGVYNENDCYGDDFNIYLLTSDCSYSCGNAFPCLAQKFGFAKIIGQTSGGGECAVAVHYLPNGEYVYHSSNLHLGYYDEAKNQFYGFEDGATPDYKVNDHDKFFDVDYLSSLIRNS